MEILEYVNTYKDNVNEFVHKIFVDEFGYQEFSNAILSSENEEYFMESNKLWIAIENEEIIGTIGIIEVSEKCAMLKKVYVKEEYRGKGIAQNLLNQCLAYAREKNYDYIFLQTYHRLERARAFYSKNGFIEYEDGYQKTHYNEIRYRLDLKT